MLENKEFNINIEEVLNELAKQRPIFHNEHDFQFELAMKIKEMYKEIYDLTIRLEYYIGQNENGNRQYIDMLVIDKESNQSIVIELKYKTRIPKNQKKSKEYIEFENEIYDLKEQGAVNHNCYYIYQDIKRIEELLKNNKTNKCTKHFNIVKGYVIFITNNTSYKEQRDGIFKNYSLNENKNNKVIIKKGVCKYFDEYGKVIQHYEKKHPASTERKRTNRI